MKLTEKIIDGFQYEGPAPRRDIRWDSEVRRFGVRVYPSGRKAFVIGYRFHGRKRLMVLDEVGVLSLRDGRQRAIEMLALVGKDKSAEDPLAIRQKIKQGETVRDLCTTYLERHAKKHKRSWRDDEGRINRHIIKRWGSRKAADITRRDVASLHHKIATEKGNYEANRTLALLSVMFKLGATEFGFLDEGAPNPARGIKKFPELKRKRWVTQDELPQLARAINEAPNQYVRAALWLYLLTGARKTELLNAKWEHIDLNSEEPSWTIPKTKTGGEHTVPLSEEAITLLQALPRQKDNPHLLPGARKGCPLVNISKPWAKVRDVATVRLWAAMEGEPVAQLVADLTQQFGRDPAYDEVRKAATFELPAGLRDVRLHDLRRTAGSWLAQAGNSLHLISKVLNHSNVSTTQIYARFGQDSVRQALEHHGKRIWNAGHEQKANVVPIKQGKG